MNNFKNITEPIYEDSWRRLACHREKNEEYDEIFSHTIHVNLSQLPKFL